MLSNSRIKLTDKIIAYINKALHQIMKAQLLKQYQELWHQLNKSYLNNCLKYLAKLSLQHKNHKSLKVIFKILKNIMVTLEAQYN